MNMKIRLLLAMLLCCMIGLNARAEALLLTTEEAPPFNYTSEDGKSITGSATEIVREAFRRAGLAYRIEIYPWARAYHLAQTEADTCVFSTTRTEEREKLFRWVGPVATSEWVMIARADDEIRLKTLDATRWVAIEGMPLQFTCRTGNSRLPKPALMSSWFSF